MESLCKLIQKAKETNTGWDLLFKQLQPLIRGYTWEEISEHLNYSLRQIYNIHNHALEHLTLE